MCLDCLVCAVTLLYITREQVEHEGVRFWCYNAGHVIGACMFMVTIAGANPLTPNTVELIPTLEALFFRGGPVQGTVLTNPDPSTEGPTWGHPMLVLGALCSFLEPFVGI